jgi:hypothetical protein
VCVGYGSPRDVGASRRTRQSGAVRRHRSRDKAVTTCQTGPSMRSMIRPARSPADSATNSSKSRPPGIPLSCQREVRGLRTGTRTAKACLVTRDWDGEEGFAGLGRAHIASGLAVLAQGRQNDAIVSVEFAHGTGDMYFGASLRAPNWFRVASRRQLRGGTAGGAANSRPCPRCRPRLR